MRTNPLVGIIAEDDSDVDCIKTLARRISPEKTFGFKKSVGHSCGKIIRKANAWAVNMYNQGCEYLIVVHDLDRNKLPELQGKIQRALNPCPIDKNLICIPIEELEAWLLSDSESLKHLYSKTNFPKMPNFPEKIESPKEYLMQFVRKHTNSKFDYIPAHHNNRIAEHINLGLVEEKCPSFKPLKIFIQSI